MAAPTGAEIRVEILGNLPTDRFPTVTPELQEFITSLAFNLSDAWQQWQSGIIGGGLTVEGSGWPEWNGTGTGGELVPGGRLSFGAIPSYGVTKEMGELLDSMSDHLGLQFDIWVSSYEFSSAVYSGTSTATATTAGVFNATPIGQPLSEIGAGESPGAIREAVLQDLEQLGWRPYVTDDEGYRIPAIPEFLSAFDGMIATLFPEWLGDTLWLANTVTGPSAAGTGSGTGVSLNDGVLQ